MRTRWFEKCKVDMHYLFRELREPINPGKVFVYRSGMKTLLWMPKNRKVLQIVAWEWGEGIMLLQMQASSRGCKHASVLFAFAFCWSSHSSLLCKAPIPRFQQIQLGKMLHFLLPGSSFAPVLNVAAHSQGCWEDISAPELLALLYSPVWKHKQHLLCFMF